MAEIVENGTMEVMPTNEHIPSNGKTNAALTTGIIGTALGAINLLGTGWLGTKMNGGSTSSSSNGNCINQEELYLERQLANDKLISTTQMYQDKLSNQRELTNAFFDAYKRDIDNSFMLYKNQRDMYDSVNKEQHDNYDALNQKIIDTSFNLYKNQRDEKDVLNNKINELQSKVDVMAAIRPYQDALINCKIDKNALESDFKLAKRTCRMIEGQLVLPDNLVSGYTSYNPIVYQP